MRISENIHMLKPSVVSSLFPCNILYHFQLTQWWRATIDRSQYTLKWKFSLILNIYLKAWNVSKIYLNRWIHLVILQIHMSWIQAHENRYNWNGTNFSSSCPSYRVVWFEIVMAHFLCNLQAMFMFYSITANISPSKTRHVTIFSLWWW